MTTQADIERMSTDIKKLKDIADLLDINIKEILEILPSLATREQVDDLKAAVSGLVNKYDRLDSRHDQLENKVGLMDEKLDRILALLIALQE